MRYWFFAAVLANVLLLLWEFHYGAFDAIETPDASIDGGEKQILLLSEIDAGAMRLPGPEESVPLPNMLAEAGMPIAEQLAEPVTLERDLRTAAAGEKKLLPVSSAVPSTVATAQPEKMPIEASQTTEVPAQTQSVQTEQTAVAQQPPAPPPKPEIVRTACYTVGLVGNTDVLEALLGRYRSQLAGLEHSTTKKRKNDSYLVYYPGTKTLEEALATAETLRSKYGINDLLVYRKGDLQGVLSLGVFSNEQRAKTAQSQLAAKGLRAEIRPRYPLEDYYSLRLRWNEQQAGAAQQLSDALKSRFAARRAASGCK